MGRHYRNNLFPSLRGKEKEKSLKSSRNTLILFKKKKKKICNKCLKEREMVYIILFVSGNGQKSHTLSNILQHIYSPCDLHMIFIWPVTVAPLRWYSF